MRRKIAKFLRRAGRLSARDLKRMLVPRRFDEYLYSLEVDDSHCPPAPVEGLAVEVFDGARRSGDARIDGQLDVGNVYFAARVADQLVHESWLIFDVVFQLQFGYDPDVPVIGHCVTTEQFRGRGIYPYMLSFIKSYCCNHNICKLIYVIVSQDNTPSIRGIERAGCRRLARLTGYRAMGLLMGKKAIRY